MDLPGALLHAENDEVVVMFMKGKMAELMVYVALQIYRKYIMTMKQGGKILYMKMQKALYEMLERALLFYKNSEMTLKIMVFK